MERGGGVVFGQDSASIDLNCLLFVERDFVNFLRYRSPETIPTVRSSIPFADRLAAVYVFVYNTGPCQHLCLLRAGTETEHQFCWPTVSPSSPLYPLLRATWLPLQALEQMVQAVQFRNWKSLEHFHGVVVSDSEPTVWYRRNNVETFLCMKDYLLEMLHFLTQLTTANEHGMVVVNHSDPLKRWGFFCRYETRGHPDYVGELSFHTGGVTPFTRNPVGTDLKLESSLYPMKCECSLNTNNVLERYERSSSGIYSMCQELQTCQSDENVYVASDRLFFAVDELSESLTVRADLEGVWIHRNDHSLGRVFISTNSLLDLYAEIVEGVDVSEYVRLMDEAAANDGGPTYPAPEGAYNLPDRAFQIVPETHMVYALCRRGRTALCRVEHLASLLTLCLACACRVRQSLYTMCVHFMYEQCLSESEHRWYLFRTHKSMCRGAISSVALHLMFKYGSRLNRRGRKRNQRERMNCSDIEVKRMCGTDQDAA